MKNFLPLWPFIAFALVASALAYAQDKSDLLRQQNVTAFGATVAFLDDGGCTFQAQGVAAWDSGTTVQVQSAPYPFNGGRCTTVRNAGANALNLTVGVGDGGTP